MLTRVSGIETLNSNHSPLTRQQEQLVRAAIQLGAGTGDETKVYFLHSTLTQVSFPRKRVYGDRFERRSGGASILLCAGELWNGAGFEMQILPYGPMPRLIMASISTYAIQRQTRVIPVGDSASSFLRT